MECKRTLAVSRTKDALQPRYPSKMRSKMRARMSMSKDEEVEDEDVEEDDLRT